MEHRDRYTTKRNLRPGVGGDSMASFLDNMKQAVKAISDLKIDNGTFFQTVEGMAWANRQYALQTGRPAIDIYDGEGHKRREVAEIAREVLFTK